MATTPTYSWPTPDDTDLVKLGAEAIRDLALAIESTVSALGGTKKIETFLASGSWVVPSGVTYAIAHIKGAGGGINTSGATAGGNSEVVFASGTVTATGGGAHNQNQINSSVVGTNGAPNSGDGGIRSGQDGGNRGYIGRAGNGAFVVHAATVTPAASITVTVGAGGSGTGAGGSGIVWIEYYE